MKYVCQKCGAPTDNDQSFDLIPIRGLPPSRLEVHRCGKCDKRFKQELEWESDGETLWEDKIICPYCGYEYGDYESCSYDHSTDEVECAACGRKFDLQVEVKKTFSTKRSLCEMPDNYGEEDEENDSMREMRKNH